MMEDLNVEKMSQEVKEQEERYAKLGQELFRSLYSTLKTASLYEANNNRYISKATEFRQFVAEVFTENKKLSFSLKDGYFFLNKFRINLTTRAKSINSFSD